MTGFGSAYARLEVINTAVVEDFGTMVIAETVVEASSAVIYLVVKIDEFKLAVLVDFVAVAFVVLGVAGLWEITVILALSVAGLY